MGNHILNQGVVTPFVQFNFANGSIESDNGTGRVIPRYFISLAHNRTCKQACTYKLTIVYVPDTFSVGRPTLIDNMIVSSKNEKVTYQYGYYDWSGARHPQYATYVGVLNKYTCDVNVESGTLTYTIEGNAVAVELLNDQTSLNTKQFNMYRYKPSEVLKFCSDVSSTTNTEPIIGPVIPSPEDYMTARPFEQLGLYYERVIYHTDEFVYLPPYEQQGMLDIILGTAKAATESDNSLKQTNIDRDGGIVQHSRMKVAQDATELYSKGYINIDEYTEWIKANEASSHYDWRTSDEVRNKTYKIIDSMQSKLYIPFMAYFDDVSNMSKKYGTFYYVPKTKGVAADTFVYEYGNNVRQSDVLNINFSYDGSVALSNATASDSLSLSIDATGQNIGQNNSTTSVLSLGRNGYATLSGFREDRFLSERELTEYMIYPSKATMTILGQIQPSNLLDIVDVIVLINGTRHPTLSGEYTVIEINDNVSDNGFTTELTLVRKEDTSKYLADKADYYTNDSSGTATQTQDKIDKEIVETIKPVKYVKPKTSVFTSNA